MIVGALAAIIGAALLIGGAALVWAHGTQRDADGYYTSRSRTFATATYALTADVDLGKAPGERGWTIGHPVGTVRITATAPAGAAPLFVGIAPTADVDR